MKVTCEFGPKQDLHGQDSPYPAGGGKNLFREDIWFDAISYPNSGAYGYYYVDNLVLKPNTAYTISAIRTGTEPGNGINYFFGTVSGFGQRSIITNGSVNIPGTLTTGEDGLIKIGINKGTASTIQDALDVIKNNVKFQLEEGSTATAYAPYSNICSIEGWDGANVKHCGKNLFNKNDPNIITGCYFTRNGTTFANANYAISYVPVNPGDKLVYSGLKGGNGNPCGVQFFDANKTFLAMGNPDVQQNNVAVTAPSGAAYIGISVFYANNVLYKDDDTAQLEIGSVATDYEPYQGTTLPIPFNNPGTYDFLPVQAGTGDPSPENVRPITPGLTLTRDDNSTLEVWGGSLTVNEDGSGTLVADVIGKRVTSDLGTINFSVDRVRYTVTDMLSVDAVTTISNQRYLCNIFPKVYGSTAPGIIFTQNGDGTVPFILFRGLDSFGITNTLEGWNQFITDNEVFITYVLATPVTYNLTVAETSRAFEALGLGKNLGPLYGGSVTINEDGSGTLIKFLKIDVLDGNNSEGWIQSGIAFYSGKLNDYSTVSQAKAISNMYISKGVILGRNGLNVDCSFGFYNGGARIYVRDDQCDTIEAFKAKLGTNNLVVVYELAEPVTYNLTALQVIETLKGTNNIWSDLNGPITVEYYNNEKE